MCSNVFPRRQLGSNERNATVAPFHPRCDAWKRLNMCAVHWIPKDKGRTSRDTAGGVHWVQRVSRVVFASCVCAKIFTVAVKASGNHFSEKCSGAQASGNPPEGAAVGRRTSAPQDGALMMLCGKTLAQAAMFSACFTQFQASPRQVCAHSTTYA